MQYASDVINNLCDGKTGLDALKPTSSVGTYIAAGVTALIPGKGLFSALARNVVEEGISVTEKAIIGHTDDIDLGSSLLNIAVGTVLDAGAEKVADKVSGYIKSKAPYNYSSYAHEVRKKTPQFTRQQIDKRMKRVLRYNRGIITATETVINIGRECLPF